MELGILWEAFNILIDNRDYQLILLVFGVSAVIVLSIMHLWRHIKEAKDFERF